MLVHVQFQSSLDVSSQVFTSFLTAVETALETVVGAHDQDELDGVCIRVECVLSCLQCLLTHMNEPTATYLSLLASVSEITDCIHSAMLDRLTSARLPGRPQLNIC